MLIHFTPLDNLLLFAALSKTTLWFVRMNPSAVFRTEEQKSADCASREGQGFPTVSIVCGCVCKQFCLCSYICMSILLPQRSCVRLVNWLVSSRILSKNVWEPGCGGSSIWKMCSADDMKSIL